MTECGLADILTIIYPYIHYVHADTAASPGAEAEALSLCQLLFAHGCPAQGVDGGACSALHWWVVLRVLVLIAWMAWVGGL